MYKKDHSHVKKRSVLVDTISLQYSRQGSNIDTIIEVNIKVIKIL